MFKRGGRFQWFTALGSDAVRAQIKKNWESLSLNPNAAVAAFRLKVYVLKDEMNPKRV